MSDPRETDAGRVVGDPVRLTEFFQRMVTAHAPSAVAALALEAIQEAAGVERAVVYLRDPESGVYRPGAGDASLLPESAVLEYVEQEGKPATVPHPDGSIITVLPLVAQGKPAGVAVIDVTAGAEELARADVRPLLLFLEQTAAMLHLTRLIHRSEEQFTLLTNILDSITNGILTLDSDRRITRLNRNAMAMLELSPEDTGRPLREALPGEIPDAIESMAAELETGGFSLERMLQRRFSSGLTLPIALSVSLLRDPAGRPLGTIAVFRDMTASRELERLRKLDEMKSEFVSNVSHELKTPLTSIKAYTEALQEMVEDDQQKHFLKVVEEESDRLLFLINDLLNVSRIQSGKMKLNLDLCDPRTVVSDILKISKVQSDQHEIVLELADALPEMLLDREKMKEVSINLISNAIKYSPKGGKVWVRMFAREGNLVLEIEDQGMGIAPENLSRLFDAFYRVDSSLTAEIPGTGLGLSIVKAIVEHHGGKVWVDSTPGKGSRFSVMIPIRREQHRGEGMEAMT